MDPFSLVLFGFAALLLVGMFFSNRKRQKAAQEMNNGLVPGAEVMTGSGIFGTIVDVDEVEGRVQLEIAPGTVITLHRQAIARVVPQPVPDDEENVADQAEAIVSESAEAIAKAGEDTAVLPASQRKSRKKPADDSSND